MSGSPERLAARSPERLADRLPWRRQSTILAARYRATLLGDPATVLLLVAQAPFIGWLCTLVWGSVERDTPSLYFVMCLSAVWFGCIAACREIVRERAIFERERFFGVGPLAYVSSKARVLAALSLTQVALLQAAVEWKLALKGAYLAQTFALWGASLCGVGLGLFVSALSKSQERAVGAVPLLILPQILFSEFAVPKGSFEGAVAAVEKLMPVHWAYRIFTELASDDGRWGWVAASGGILLAFALALALMTVGALVPRREV